MDEKISEDEIMSLIPLDKQDEKLANDIIKEDDIDNVKNLVHQFNLNQAKKNVLRVMKYNSLLDKVSDQMLERLEKCPGQFNNADLISYLSATQNAIDRANKSIALVDDSPTIQLTQVNINQEQEPLSRESREKVTEAIQALLKKWDTIQLEPDEVKIEDKKEDEE